MKNLIKKTKSTNIRRTNEALYKMQKEADEKLFALDKTLAQNFKLYEKQHEIRVSAIRKELDKIALVTAENIINKLGSTNVDNKSLTRFLN